MVDLLISVNNTSENPNAAAEFVEMIKASGQYEIVKLVKFERVLHENEIRFNIYLKKKP